MAALISSETISDVVDSDAGSPAPRRNFDRMGTRIWATLRVEGIRQPDTPDKGFANI